MPKYLLSIILALSLMGCVHVDTRLEQKEENDHLDQIHERRSFSKPEIFSHEARDI